MDEETWFFHQCSQCRKLFEIQQPLMYKMPEKNTLIVLSGQKDLSFLKGEGKIIQTLSPFQIVLLFMIVKEVFYMKDTMKEFKEFISKGNIIDMAVGVVMGTAFTAIVTALVNNIIMPLVGVIMGGLDFSGLVAQIGDAKIEYGLFIQAVVNFLIVALCMFSFIKFLSKLKKPAPEPEPEVEEVSDEVKLLTEIRDALVQKDESSDNMNANTL